MQARQRGFVRRHVPGQKFAEPVALWSTIPVSFPLSRTTGWDGFSLLALGVHRRFGIEDEVAESVWLHPAWTSCDELEPEGEPGVILVDRGEA